jgi:NAD(P)-dependent dehydrogenase (short-subunit alcohol dehydrogenase family)
VIALIEKEGRTGLAIPGDLRDEAFCKKLVEQALQGLGGLDIVVCNAARQQSRESILDVSSEDFDATMKSSIYAAFRIIKAAASEAGLVHPVRRPSRLTIRLWNSTTTHRPRPQR